MCFESFEELTFAKIFGKGPCKVSARPNTSLCVCVKCASCQEVRLISLTALMLLIVSIHVSILSSLARMKFEEKLNIVMSKVCTCP